MSTAAPKAGGWSGGRFLAVTVVLFAAQAGLVLLFAARPGRASYPPVVRTVVRVLGAPLNEAALSKFLFAADPAIFPISSPHGFADQAWLRLPPLDNNKATNDSEPPSFLQFADSRLVAGVAPSFPNGAQIPFDLVGPPALPQEALPVYPATDGSRAESFFRIEGALAGRQMSLPVPLRAWAGSAVLSNTVVQFAISPSGQVVLAGLWSGSGLHEADASAVEAVNALVFRPAGTSAAALTWDKATFYWRTVQPPPATNAPLTAIPTAP